MTLNYDLYTKLKNNILSPNCTGELEFESLQSIKEICNITKPKYILELGFNRGISTIMFLESSPAMIHSIDIRSVNEVKKSLDYIYKTYPGRFLYTQLDHKKLNEFQITNDKTSYDLIFIDGDHSYEAMYNDTKNSINLNPKYILFDDYYHIAHSNDVKKVINDYSLEIVTEFDTSCGHVLTINPNYISK